MAATATPFTSQPFVRPAYVPEVSNLLQLLQAASQAKQRALLETGQRKAEGRMQIGALIADAIGAYQQDRARKAAMADQSAFAQQKLAQEHQEKVIAEQDKARDFALRAAEFQSTQAQQRATNARLGQQDARLAANDAVENTNAGPIDPASAATLRAYPGTAPLVSSQTELPARPVSPEMAPMAAPTQFDVRGQTPKEVTQAAAVAEANRRAEAAAMRQAAMDKRQALIDQRNFGHQQVMEQQGQARINAANAQANPFGGAPLGPTGAAGPTGEDFIKTLPPSQASQVKALAEGRQPFPTGMSYAKLQPLIAAVTQYDPTFDAANYTARSKARSDLTSPNGQGGKVVNSLNTAIQHAGKLSDLIEALDNSDYPRVNAIANWLSKETGGTKVTNFEAVQPQLMKEVERLWRGAGGSTEDINALKASMGPNLGKQQQREALAQFVGLMEGKLQSTEQQRDNILGPAAGKSVPILFDQSLPELEKIKNRASGKADAVPVVKPNPFRKK